MKKTFINLLLITSALFFLSNPLFSQVKEHVFKGNIVGSFVNEPSSNAAIFYGRANATGNATQIGNFSKVTGDVVNMVSSTIEGTFVMTSAGCQQLTGRYSGTFSIGPTPGTLSWVLNATITGGTGRFSNATGKFVFVATGKYVITNGVPSGDYTETFEGTITF